MRIPFVSAARRRAAALLAAAALGAAVLAGCTSDNVDCGVDACTITFDRGVDAGVNVFGTEARLIGADGDRVTVEVAGERLSLTVGEQATEVGGLAVSVQSVSDTEVKVRVAR